MMERNRILSVDDSKVIRKILAGAVELLGYSLLEAEDGEKALAVLNAHAPEVALILLDWNMPGLNGYETLCILKQQPSTRDIPVMMVTTESERINVVRAIKAGAIHYLTKPFTQEDLLSRMMECLEAVPA